LRSGNYFGELALLTDKPRAATVTAVTQVNCAILDTKGFPSFFFSFFFFFEERIFFKTLN